jgi:hypothetical protein
MAQAPQRPFQRPQQQRPQAQQRHPQAQHERDPLSEQEPEQQRGQRFEDPLRDRRGESQGSIFEPEAPQPDPPVKTIADEQRERSAEMEAMGMEAWKAAHDDRSLDEQPQQIPGVSPTQIEDDDRRSRSR